MAKITLFLLILSLSTFAQNPDFEESEAIHFNSNPKKIRKNAIVGQIAGDTPWIGMNYQRRIYEKKKWMFEAGVGASLKNILTDNLNVLAFNHSFTAVYDKTRIIQPYIKYSGIIASHDFYNQKNYNYVPAPGFGIRIGSSDFLAVNMGVTSYFYSEARNNLTAENKIETYKRSIWSNLPTISLQASF